MFSLFAKSQPYEPLSQEKDSEDDEYLRNHNNHLRRTSQAHSNLISLVIAFSITVNVILLFHAFGVIGKWSQETYKTSPYLSPVDEQVPPRWEITRFNGSLAKETIYRKPASPEVDKAWEDLGVKVRFIGVEPNTSEKYGLHPWQVKISEEAGGGVIANIEVFHQLHCLNLLRKGSHWDFDYYWRKEHEEDADGVFSGDEDAIRLHFTHCLDMLRQRIMCTADTGVFGQVWLKNEHKATIDFNTAHVCRNFHDVQKWMDENAVASGHELVPVKYQAGDKIVNELP